MTVADDIENWYSVYFEQKFAPELLCTLKERLSKGAHDDSWKVPSNEERAQWKYQIAQRAPVRKAWVKLMENLTDLIMD